jgi:hypothetical protein
MSGEIKTTKQASAITAKSTTVVSKEDIQKSNELKWSQEGRKYKWAYLDSKEYINLSDFEEETNSRYLIHALTMFIQTCEFDDSYKSIIADKLTTSITDNIKLIDTLSSSFDQREFICKLESVIDHVG